MSPSHSSGIPVNAIWRGVCPDPPHPDYVWELSVGLDSENGSHVEVFAHDINQDKSGLAALTPAQARQVAATLNAAADRMDVLNGEST
jgi:hypothetical protein